MKTKKFDCVEMKRRGAERVHNIIKDMTPQQELEYWRKRSEEFKQEQEHLRAEAVTASEASRKRL
jgi:hypothetical protein